MNLSREKEKFFLDTVIPAKDIINEGNAQTAQIFYNQLSFNLHRKSASLDDLISEIKDNLLLITETKSRTAYFNRLKGAINTSKKYINSKIDLLNNESNNNFVFTSLYDPKIGIVQSFEIKKDALIGHYKTSLYYLEILMRFVEKMAAAEFMDYSSVDDLTSRVHWTTLIEPALISRLIEIEEKIKVKILNWESGTSKIECAAFCELLYDKHYFLKGSKRIKSLNAFALSKYGLSIENQLLASKKNDRNLHKKRLSTLFN